MAVSGLSSADKGVLNSIFNPHLPYSDVPQEDQDTIANTNQNTSEHLSEQDRAALAEAQRLEVEGVKSAEAGDLSSALELLNTAIGVAPQHASAYNNRAQVLRLKTDTQGAMEDLDKAIELSGGVGKAACQAYTQRGLINRLEGKEDEALADLRKAACLGSEFAKSLVVQLNPYAAMCNEMLVEVIEKIRHGEQ